jgi:uncharacterized membrane protein
MLIIQGLFLLLFPYAAIKISGATKKFGFTSPILLCYMAGILIGNLDFIPIDKNFSMTVAEIAIPFAIPFILFSTDFVKWISLAKKTIISFCLVIVSVVVSAALGAVIFSRHVDEYWKISAMLTGVYIGGTPNLMAIGMGLNINEKTLILVNTADAVAGGLYFLFLIGPAKWILSKFLPPFKAPKGQETDGVIEQETNTLFLSMSGSEKLERMREVLPAFITAAVILGASVGIALLLTGDMNIAIVMLAITTFSIAASFVKRIRRIRGTYEIGQYIILIFSLGIGMTVNFKGMMASSPTILLFTLFVMTVAILVHYILAAICKIDVDTAIITSTAGIFGPPFVGPVANAIKNREVIVSGLTSGLVGYAVGNYIGFMLAYIIMP